KGKGADVGVEVQIVDMGAGTLDSSFVVVGSDNALIELESDVAHAVIEKLGVALTGADTRRLESFRATDVGAYRRFLATEGENPGPPLHPHRRRNRPVAHRAGSSRDRHGQRTPGARRSSRSSSAIARRSGQEACRRWPGSTSSSPRNNAPRSSTTTRTAPTCA